MSRFVLSLFLTLAFVASSTTDLFAQASRGRQKADVGASKEAPVPAGGLAVTVPEFGQMEAGRGPVSVVATIKGGKAPYALTLEPADAGVTIEAVDNHPEQYKLVVDPTDAGEIIFKLNVSDSSEPKLEVESREVVVHVSAKKTNLDDLEARLQSLEIKAEAIKALFSGPAGREQVGDLQKQVKDLAEQVDFVLTIVKYGGMGFVALFVLFLGFLFFRSKGKGTASHAIALLLLFGAVVDMRAATPVVCGSLTYNNNAVPDDGTEVEMICKGLNGKKLEIDDPKVTVTDVKSVPAGLSFKVKAVSGAALDYPTVKVDGKDVETTLEIVSAAEWISRDRTAVTMKQMVGGNGGGDEKLFKSFLLGLAQEHGLDYQMLLKKLQSSQKGTSREVVAAIEGSREKRIKGAVFEDSRYQALKAKADALQAKADALEARVDGMPAGVTEDRAKELAAEAVKPTTENLGKLAVQTATLAEAVEAVGNATYVVESAKKRVFGRDTLAKTAPVSVGAAQKAAGVKQQVVRTWNLP